MVRVDLAATVLDSDDGRAVVTGKDSRYHLISDLKGATFGISRLGSGSQVMASVLGMNEGWTGSDHPEFKGTYLYCPQGPADCSVNGQFKPLRDSVNAGDCALYSQGQVASTDVQLRRSYGSGSLQSPSLIQAKFGS